MTYLLVCALCAGAAGRIAPQERGLAASTAAVEADLGVAPGRNFFEFDGARGGPLRFAEGSATDGHSGHDDAGHMGPMTVMMGVMMVGMMVALGAYMMRGHWAIPLTARAVGPLHLSAPPPVTAFRFGG